MKLTGHPPLVGRKSAVHNVRGLGQVRWVTLPPQHRSSPIFMCTMCSVPAFRSKSPHTIARCLPVLPPTLLLIGAVHEARPRHPRPAGRPHGARRDRDGRRLKQPRRHPQVHRGGLLLQHIAPAKGRQLQDGQEPTDGAHTPELQPGSGEGRAGAVQRRKWVLGGAGVFVGVACSISEA